ncbi:hypothetical protein BX666DRAFT_1887463 [Dichotomocladium elegans]|nr:hypothetical protein BX666DRAFT_1887463 [Dichotomocladium elegans]
MLGAPFLLTILKGKCFMSFWTSLSLKRRPIKRLASKTVRSGLAAYWFLAASPIRRSSSVKAT